MADFMAPTPSIAFREMERGPAHCRIAVFVGRSAGARGYAGDIVMRTDEWDELRQEYKEGWYPIEVLPSLAQEVASR